MRLVTILLAIQLDALASSLGAPGDPSATGPMAYASPADTSGAPHVTTLSDLRPGDELIVDYTTYSCFHVAVYKFVFRRGAVLSVTVDLVRSAPAGVRTPRRLAILAVTDSAAADLDQLVRVHRDAIPHRATGGVRLELTQMRDGSVVAREVVANNPIIRRLGSYGFEELASRARRAAPASAFVGEYR